MSGRAVPRPSPETAEFWAGTASAELRLPRCRPNGHVYFPPRPRCPICGTTEIDTIVASGRARLCSYVISYLPAPGIEPPFVLAVVELEEGPRLLTNIVDVEPRPDVLALDEELTVTFLPLGELALPVFRPAGTP
jgi:uncharacterized OB-fold protein